jgi:hypothetical protein
VVVREDGARSSVGVDGQGGVGDVGGDGPPGPARPRATERNRLSSGLPVTPLQQVFGSRLEAFGAGQFEAEGVIEPVSDVEDGADRERVLHLLG